MNYQNLKEEKKDNSLHLRSISDINYLSLNTAYIFTILFSVLWISHLHQDTFSRNVTEDVSYKDVSDDDVLSRRHIYRTKNLNSEGGGNRERTITN